MSEEQPEGEEWGEDDDDGSGSPEGGGDIGPLIEPTRLSS